MSAGEIEDVLSSIRRLVSEELRPMNRSTPPEPPMVLAAAEKAKLVLSPAFRVAAETEIEPVLASEIPVASGPLPLTAPILPGSEADEESDVTEIGVVVFQSRMTAAAIPAPQEEAPPVEAPPVEAQTPADPLEPHDPSWADRAEAEVMAALAGAPDEAAEAAGEQAEGASIFTEDLRFDEALLRDLVRDLIRDELQGALGERITRNVRKLVRIEVARALSLQDYE